jgi:hypothetical protein
MMVSLPSAASHDGQQVRFALLAGRQLAGRRDGGSSPPERGVCCLGTRRHSHV